MTNNALMRRVLVVALTVILLSTSISLPTISAQGGGDSDSTAPANYKLNVDRLRHIYQGWNNCGPATLTMGLSFYGYQAEQTPAADFMKPHYEDKNVNPWEMTAFVNETQSPNLQALYRPGGDMELLKTLLSNDFPVIIEEGYQPDGYDWMGHYLLLIGYDDNEQIFYNYDSFLGHGNLQGLRNSYQDIEEFWWHFNNTFIVIYEPAREELLMELLGERADMVTAHQLAFTEAQARAAENPEDNWAWFNAGDSLASLGYYQQASDYFTVAFEKGMPWRTLWYRHTPFEAYYNIGQFNTVIQMVQNAKLTTPYVEEFHYWHGMVFASQGRAADANAQFNQALTYNRNYEEAREAKDAVANGTFTPVAQTD